MYYAVIEPVGQVSAQAPQSMQVSGSISYWFAPSEIEPVGHSAAQAPQLMHSLLIVYAIVNQPPFQNNRLYSNISEINLQGVFH